MKKEENDFEIVVFMLLGIVLVLAAVAPVIYVASQKGKKDGVIALNREFIILVSTMALIAAAASYLCKIEGLTFIFKNHEIPIWILIAWVSVNSLALGLCALTRPLWIKLPFFNEEQKREKVF